MGYTGQRAAMVLWPGFTLLQASPGYTECLWWNEVGPTRQSPSLAASTCTPRVGGALTASAIYLESLYLSI